MRVPYSRKILQLGKKWIDGSISQEEKQQLFEWYDSFDDTQLELDPEQARIFHLLQQDMLDQIKLRLGHGTGMATDGTTDAAPPDGNTGYARKKHISWLKPAAAAAAIVLLIAGAWYFTSPKKLSLSPAAVASTMPPPKQDILAGSDKATLTLDDGSTIVLDNASAGNLATQGNTRVRKTDDGRIMYTAAAPSARSSYNVLSTPKGGQYQLTLQDGTNVWLNAGSSIRYPTAFTGNERRVEVTGEAYFDVARNPAVPFRVTVKSRKPQTTEIEVLGTAFNVNAYDDEPNMKTTLVEGAVRLKGPSATTTLRPAQQAILGDNGEIFTVAIQDLDQVIAWKEGAFEFDHADIATVMRQISRWYDVDVIYQGPVTADEFSGRFSRKTSLAGVLKILNISGVQLMAENKKIVIKST